jgi:hypothetical protein
MPRQSCSGGSFVAAEFVDGPLVTQNGAVPVPATARVATFAVKPLLRARLRRRAGPCTTSRAFDPLQCHLNMLPPTDGAGGGQVPVDNNEPTSPYLVNKTIPNDTNKHINVDFSKFANL